MPDDKLSQAIALVKSGKKDEARVLLLQILKEDHRNETAWLWLAQALPNDEQRISALEQCLRFVPNSQKARRGLEILQARQNEAQDFSQRLADISSDATTASNQPSAKSTSSTPPFTVSPDSLPNPEPAPIRPTPTTPKDAPQSTPIAAKKGSRLSTLEISLIGGIALIIIGICAFLGWSFVLSPIIYPVKPQVLATATIKASITPRPTMTPFSAPTRRPSSTPTPAPTIDPNNPAIIFQDVDCTIKAVSLTGGDPIQLTIDQTVTCNSPQISPDGQKILYTISDEANPISLSLFVSNVDGSSPTVVLDKTEYLYNVHWAPDSSLLSYATSIGSNDAGPVLGIFLIGEDGTGKIQLTNADSGSVEPLTDDDIVWSPDGQWLAFIGGGRLQAVNINSTQVVKLSPDKALGASLVWSPDSSRVAYYSPDEDKKGIVIAGLDGSQTLVVNPSLTIPNNGRGLTWTPDGEQLIVYHTAQKALVLVSLDGAEVKPLVNVDGLVSRMIWSPDGTQLAFIELASPGSIYGQLKVVNIDGSGLTTLSSLIKDVPFSWKIPNNGSQTTPLATNSPVPTGLPSPTSSGPPAN